MGRDPTRSVVDASGAIHGIPNLVIADASVLVTEGAGDSPSLTIQALALRSAELLAERGVTVVNLDIAPPGQDSRAIHLQVDG